MYKSKQLPQLVASTSENNVAQQSCIMLSNTETQQKMKRNNDVGTSESKKMSTENDKSESKNDEVQKKEKPQTRRFFKSRSPKDCYFCACATPTLDELNAHLLDAHCELIFLCNICQRYLPRLQLLTHMSEHAQKCAQPAESVDNNEARTTTTGYKCEQCQKHFRSISGIKYHMNALHFQLKLFACSICDLRFAAKRVLENHNRSRHGGRDKKRSYECSTCGKCFKTDSTLYTHQKLHSDERRHKCNECGKSFRLKHHLTAHQVQHANYGSKEQLPFECSCCHKRFAAADNLRKHRKIHDQTLGDFVCHICGARMRQKRYLRQHQRKVHLQRLTRD